MKQRNLTLVWFFVLIPLLLLFQNCLNLNRNKSSSSTNQNEPNPTKTFIGGNGSGYDGKPYILSGEPCSDGSVIRSRILLTANSSFYIRKDCVDYPLTEIPRDQLYTDPSNSNGFTLAGVPFHLELGPVQIPLLTRFYTQLTGTVDPNKSADVYVVDLFDTDATTIQQIKTNGKKVVCSFSAGTAENWTPDYSSFLDSMKGNALSSSNDEFYLNIRSPQVRNLILARLDLARNKGCLGVDFDNMDLYDANSGFSISQEDQVAYNAILSYAAHDRSLFAGFHNAQEIIPRMVNAFDYVNADSCFQFNECEQYRAFTASNKPAFMISFDPLTAGMCTVAKDLGLSLSRLPINLDGSIFEYCTY